MGREMQLALPRVTRNVARPAILICLVFPPLLSFAFCYGFSTLSGDPRVIATTPHEIEVILRVNRRPWEGVGPGMPVSPPIEEGRIILRDCPINESHDENKGNRQTTQTCNYWEVSIIDLQEESDKRSLPPGKPV